MSAKITDIFQVVKKTDSISTRFPQKKVKDEAKNKPDQQQIGKNVKNKIKQNWAILGKIVHQLQYCGISQRLYTGCTKNC